MGKFSVVIHLLLATCATLGSVVMAAEPALAAVNRPIHADTLLDPLLPSQRKRAPVRMSEANPQASQDQHLANRTEWGPFERIQDGVPPAKPLTLPSVSGQQGQTQLHTDDSMQTLSPETGGTVIWQLILAATGVLAAFAYLFRGQSRSPGRPFTILDGPASMASTGGPLRSKAQSARQVVDDPASEQDPSAPSPNRMSRSIPISETREARCGSSGVRPQFNQGSYQACKPWL